MSELRAKETKVAFIFGPVEATGAGIPLSAGVVSVVGSMGLGAAAAGDSFVVPALMGWSGFPVFPLFVHDFPCSSRSVALGAEEDDMKKMTASPCLDQ